MNPFGLALLVLAILFYVVYVAVRLAVSHAIRSTVREDLLQPLPAERQPRPFALDAGDELDA